jgi:hypothetical protein
VLYAQSRHEGLRDVAQSFKTRYVLLIDGCCSEVRFNSCVHLNKA